jgi:putative glutamine amidotransferase
VVPPVADIEQISQIVDGWLIPGGDDIDASRFGQENHPNVSLQDPARYSFEHDLWEVLPVEVPVFGICYGCQFLNVVRGGTLIQHLPDVPGVQVHTGGGLQEYNVAPGSALASVVAGALTSGKSYHHQAVDRVADGMSVSARSQDGVVEALEATDRPWVIGVQWHPERTLDDKNSRALFSNFVQAASHYSVRRQKQV